MVTCAPALIESGRAVSAPPTGKKLRQLAEQCRRQAANLRARGLAPEEIRERIGAALEQPRWVTAEQAAAVAAWLEPLLTADPELEARRADPARAERKRVARLTGRAHARRVRAMDRWATPEAIARVMNDFRETREQRAARGGSRRTRERYGTGRTTRPLDVA